MNRSQHRVGLSETWVSTRLLQSQSQRPWHFRPVLKGRFEVLSHGE